ncbi:MAG: hypothetical protein IKB70_12875 [Bacilli bacterium]|nr:hypothetical protein [Bacilli bacterium]
MNKKLFLVPAILFGVVSCANGTSEPNNGSSSSSNVSIKALSAVLHEEEEEPLENAPLMTLDTSEESDTSESEPETPDPNDYIPEGQYIVIYKDETHIDFKIELNNPKKEAITALELECEDKNAKIALQNSKGETEWKLIKDYPVVEWGGTNRYERTFEILLDEGYTEKDCDIKVLDLEVNGEWLAKGLDKNVLDVYKVYDDDLKYEFVYNKEDEYRFRLTAGETVKNLVVSGATPVEGEENVYSVTTEGYISWEYDYEPEDGASAHWRNGKEIEFREFYFPHGDRDIWYFILDNEHGGWSPDVIPNLMYFVNFRGTDIEQEFFYMIFGDISFYYFKVTYPDYPDPAMNGHAYISYEHKENPIPLENGYTIMIGNYPKVIPPKQ